MKGSQKSTCNICDCRFQMILRGKSFDKNNLNCFDFVYAGGVCGGGSAKLVQEILMVNKCSFHRNTWNDVGNCANNRIFDQNVALQFAFKCDFLDKVKVKVTAFWLCLKLHVSITNSFWNIVFPNAFVFRITWSSNFKHLKIQYFTNYRR